MSGRRISRIQQLISYYEGSRDEEDEDEEDDQSSLEDIIDSRGTVIPWLEDQQTCQNGKAKAKQQTLQFSWGTYIILDLKLITSDI